MALTNPWSAGQDALLDFITQREQKRMLGEDRARRDRLDQEASTDRQRMREIQESQLTSLDEDRRERRELAAAERGEKAEKAKRETLNAEQLGQLLDAYDKAATPEEKYDIGVRIINSGGKMPPPARLPQRPITVSPGSTILDPDTMKPVFTAPHKPDKPGAAPKSTDNPRLPAGVQSWVQGLPQSGSAPDYQTAFKIVQSTVPKLLQQHPGLDTRALVSTLKAAYQVDASNPEGMAAAPSAPAAPPETPQGAESGQQALFNDAHAVVSAHLGRDATPQEVQKFLADPQNVAQLRGGR